MYKYNEIDESIPMLRDFNTFLLDKLGKIEYNYYRLIKTNVQGGI